MRLTRFIAGAALAFSAVATAAPQPFLATYEVKRNGSVLGEASIQLQALPDGRWRMRTVTEGTEGLAALAKVRIEEESTLRREGERWATDDYRYRQRATFSTRERSIQVNRPRGTVTLRNRDAVSEAPLEPGLLDRQAVTLALMDAVAAGRSGEWTFRVADRSRVDTQRWQAAAQVRLHTALGWRPATRIERLRDSADGKSTRVWLAREAQPLPLRIQQVDGNETIEMRVRRLR
jgi:hypothetical protein